MTRLAVKRPVTTFMVILIFLAFGFMSLVNLRMDLLPNMNIPVAVVFTNYTGASPDQVQNLITEPIEGSMARLSGLDTLSSTSSEGMSIVVMQFEQKVDIDMIAIDIREAVDRVKGSLPADATSPMVFKMDVNATAAIYISVASETDDLVALKSKVTDQIVDRIVRQEGVASVDVSGGREKEIRVDLIEDRIRGYGISEGQISQLLGLENSSMPVGSLTEASRNLTIKVDGEFVDLEQIRDMPILTARGNVVYLRDIAIITEQFKKVTSYSYINNNPAVNLTISKQSTANTVNVSKSVMKEIEKIKNEYPELDIQVILDPADYITAAIKSVTNSAFSGIILAVIILFLFLRNIRSTLVVGAAIPLSILVTFAFMYFAKMTLNLMSLGGLTLGVGMLVDNSIVVLEGVFRHMEQGESKNRAAINGAKEVSMSIVASTLTTVAVFVPVAWMGGMIAQIFNDLALSISFALFASLLVSLTFVPLACALFLSPTNNTVHKNIISRSMAKVLDGVGNAISALEKNYRRSLIWSSTHRKITLFLSMILFVGSISTAFFVGRELLPSSDQSQIDISVKLPIGATVERTKDITDQVLSRIEGIPEIKYISSNIGSGGSGMGMGGGNGGGDSASITIALFPIKDRNRNSTAIADEMRERVKDIAGAETKVEALTSMMMGPSNSGGITGEVQYSIRGDNIDQLVEASEDIVKLMSKVKGIRDVSSSIADTIPRATIKIDRKKASAYGLTAASVMNVVNVNVSGTKATTLKTKSEEIEIRVGQDSGKINSLDDVANLLVPTPSGIVVPLREIATISMINSPISISRENQVTLVTVYGSLDGRDLGSVRSDIDSVLASEYILPQGVTLQAAGNSQMMDEEIANLIFAFIVALFVVYAIMAAEFESLIYPLVIMFIVPTALSTGFLGLFIMGQTFGITAALGMIMLLGIVVNNGIVLIDYINLLRSKGMNLLEAVQEAGPVRLRAILMTTLTTVLGLVPMMIVAQEGSEMMQPLATVVVWGLSFSTLITLFIVPVIYIIMDNIRTKFSGNGKSKLQLQDGVLDAPVANSKPKILSKNSEQKSAPAGYAPMISGKSDYLRHKIIDVIIIAILASLCDAKSYAEIEAYGRKKKKWLSEFLELPNGIPSQQNFKDVFSVIDAKTLLANFTGWATALKITLDNNKSDDAKNVLDMVSVWAIDDMVVLAQTLMSGENIEKTAIQSLLEIMDIKKCDITIQAQNIKPGIAKIINQKNAQYVLSLNESNKEFYNNVKDFFEKDFTQRPKPELIKKGMFYKPSQKNNKLKETSLKQGVVSYVCKDIQWLSNHAEWENIHGIGCVVSNDETRYYLFSLETIDAKALMEAERGHIVLPDNLNWAMDIYTEKSTDNSTENLNVLRSFGIMMAQNELSDSSDPALKLKRCANSEEYLHKVIGS